MSGGDEVRDQRRRKTHLRWRRDMVELGERRWEWSKVCEEVVVSGSKSGSETLLLGVEMKTPFLSHWTCTNSTNFLLK